MAEANDIITFLDGDPNENPWVLGRALRLDSVFSEVRAIRYHSVGPSGESTVDDIIRHVAQRKDAINQIIRSAIIDGGASSSQSLPAS